MSSATSRGRRGGATAPAGSPVDTGGLEPGDEGFLEALAKADGFLEELLLCCPVLGLRAFEQPSGKPATSSRRMFHLKGPGASGQGFKSPGGFTVLRGAQARREFVESTLAAWVQARAQLVSQGVFLEDPAGLTLAQDYEFNSPSQAAMALLARTANGRIEWKDTKGVTLKEHQERAAAAASAGVEA